MKQQTNFLNRALYFLGTGFLSGLSPRAPGTTGTIVACACACILLFAVPDSWTEHLSMLLALTFIPLSFAVTHFGLRRKVFQGDDPQEIVIDEFAGYFVTLLFIPQTYTMFMLAFFAFRFFDILKPPPIRSLEHIPHGIGIVIDDLVAGVYANLTLQLIIFGFLR